VAASDGFAAGVALAFGVGVGLGVAEASAAGVALDAAADGVASGAGVAASLVTVVDELVDWSVGWLSEPHAARAKASEAARAKREIIEMRPSGVSSARSYRGARDAQEAII
jgi:hypothetical protein